MRRGKEPEKNEARVVPPRPATAGPEEELAGGVDTYIEEAQLQLQLRKLQKAEKENTFFKRLAGRIKEFRTKINSIGQKK